MHSTNINTSIYSTHVFTEDTIWREMRWKITSKNIVKIVEESIVDLEAKTVTFYTRNLGYTKVMVIESILINGEIQVNIR